MTMMDEKFRAILWARQFLRYLLRERKRTPKDIREQARSILRHFPAEFEINDLEIETTKKYGNSLEKKLLKERLTLKEDKQ